MPWAYSDLTPKVAEEEESNLAPWAGIIAAIVVVVGIALWLIVRRRRGGPAMEE
jgi:LPXTG-motif cell wall-anchored protein